MRTIWVIAAAALVVCLTVVVAQQANLVPNGDFEKGLEGWLFDEIVLPTEAAVTNEMVHGGANALLISNGQSARGIMRSAQFTVEPGKTYRLCVWAKAEGAADNMVYARIHWWKDVPGVASEEKIKDDTEHAGGTFDWKQLCADVTAPADAHCATVRLETGGDTGVLKADTAAPFWVRFDDVTVTPVQ